MISTVQGDDVMAEQRVMDGKAASDVDGVTGRDIALLMARQGATVVINDGCGLLTVEGS